MNSQIRLAYYSGGKQVGGCPARELQQHQGDFEVTDLFKVWIVVMVLWV
jgi:hypothetical protein